MSMGGQRWVCRAGQERGGGLLQGGGWKKLLSRYRNLDTRHQSNPFLWVQVPHRHLGNLCALKDIGQWTGEAVF